MDCTICYLSFQLSLPLQLLLDLRFKFFIFGLFRLDLSSELSVMRIRSEKPSEKTDDQTSACSVQSTKGSTHKHAFQGFIQNVLSSL